MLAIGMFAFLFKSMVNLTGLQIQTGGYTATFKLQKTSVEQLRANLAQWASPGVLVASATFPKT
jgi:hypothetical protein